MFGPAKDFFSTYDFFNVWLSSSPGPDNKTLSHSHWVFPLVSSTDSSLRQWLKLNFFKHQFRNIKNDILFSPVCKVKKNVQLYVLKPNGRLSWVICVRRISRADRWMKRTTTLLRSVESSETMSASPPRSRSLLT